MKYPCRIKLNNLKQIVHETIVDSLFDVNIDDYCCWFIMYNGIWLLFFFCVGTIGENNFSMTINK